VISEVNKTDIEVIEILLFKDDWKEGFKNKDQRFVISEVNKTDIEVIEILLFKDDWKEGFKNKDYSLRS
jgi:hypothetical protein